MKQFSIFDRFIYGLGWVVFLGVLGFAALDLIGTASCRVSSGQTIVPFGVSAADAPAYARGFADGQTAATQPAIAAAVMPIQPVDKSYVIAPGGALADAIAQALRDHAQWPAFHLTPGGSFRVSLALPKGFAGITIDGGAVGSAPASWATITSDASGVGNAALFVLNSANVHVSNLVFTATPGGSAPGAPGGIPARAVYSNGVSGLWIDHCIFNGFAIGAGSDGGDGTHITNCGFFNQSAPNLGKSQGIFLASSTNWVIEGNIFYHCGWADADYNAAGDAATIKSQNDRLQLNHAIYINNDSGLTSDGIIRGNIAVDCATSAINSRVGGVCEHNVFRSNGLAADVVIQGTSGTVQHSVFFGPPPLCDRPPFFGLGIWGISRNLLVDDCYFFNVADKTPRNPAVRIDWPAAKGPLPIGTSAVVGNVHGVWVKPVIDVMPARSCATGVLDVRQPKPGEAVPSLEDFYHCAPADLPAMLRSRVGCNDAYAIESWAARSWAAMRAAAGRN